MCELQFAIQMGWGKLNVHLGVPFSADTAYDFGDRDCVISEDSCRRILAGLDDGCDEGITFDVDAKKPQGQSVCQCASCNKPEMNAR